MAGAGKRVSTSVMASQRAQTGYSTGQHSKSLYKDCVQKAQPKEAQFPAADKERLKQVAPRPGVRKLWASPLL